MGDLEEDEDALHRQLAAEYPTDLADDIDPEGREFTLEDLVTAKGSIPQSLRDELHAGDVWGAPVSDVTPVYGLLSFSPFAPPPGLPSGPCMCIVIFG